MYNSETLDHSMFPDAKLIELKTGNMCFLLCEFMNSIPEFRKPDGSEYSANNYYYLALGIQKFFNDNGRNENIFSDPEYDKFVNVFDDLITKYSGVHINSSKYDFNISMRYRHNKSIIYIYLQITFLDYIDLGCVEENHLWESKQLGAHSPVALLNTIMYFNIKIFHFSVIAHI